MLNQPTIEKLQTMKLYGMADAFREQIEMADSSQLSFEERFGLLVDRQWTWKEGRIVSLCAPWPPASGFVCITTSCSLAKLGWGSRG
jgi:hypothetical protein